MTLDERLIKVVPSKRQLEHQKLEFYGFIHFTVNTFTDKEWGDGTENPQIFNPYKLDAEQWVRSFVAAGMKGLILTCKHHDGFCLWPSALTEHSVASSPYRDGKGDIVREVSEACAKYGVKFGIYLSPWDRNNAKYGQGKAYNDYFIGQLTELLTQYGPIFSVWFDGACGEGPNGKKQVYDWERYYETVRKYQPGACISVSGPDVRWCGNEAGDTREAEWSVVPERTKDSETIAKNSQQEDNEAFRQRKVSAMDRDLGSRKILENEEKLIWYAAEVNTSIRPGWFYHKSEDDRVRSLEELIHIYNNSVGGNATFLLNVPPTPEGLIHENDVKRLEEIGEYLKKAFGKNLLDDAKLGFGGSSCDECENEDIEAVRTDNYDTYLMPVTKNPELSANWDEPVHLHNIVLKENILKSQRVESFEIEAGLNGNFEKIYTGTVIGYKRIVPVDVECDALRVRITDSRCEPTIAFWGVY